LLTSGIGIAGAALNHHWQSSTQEKEREDRLHESQATLRRETYTRLLTASDRLSDFLSTQSPRVEPEELADATMAVERLRDLWIGADELIADYNAALTQGRLLAGPEVATAIEAHDDWMVEQFGILAAHPNPIESNAFEGVQEKRGSLIQAMRHEQEKDLLSDREGIQDHPT